LESLKEIIRDRINGLFFEKSNAEELAQKILELKSDKILRKKFSVNALQTAINFKKNEKNDFEKLLLNLI
jgi:glycosyltransferase involved in cell wall biosynthesis